MDKVGVLELVVFRGLDPLARKGVGVRISPPRPPSSRLLMVRNPPDERGILVQFQSGGPNKSGGKLMRTRAQRRHFAEVKRKRKARIFSVIGTACYPKNVECDYCYFFGKGRRCPFLPNPRKEWGVLTRQEIRSQDKEKSYRDYMLWRTSTY